MSYIVRVERSRVSFTHRVWLARRDAEDSSKVRLFTHGTSLYSDQVEVDSYRNPPEDAWFCDIPDGAEHQLLLELARCLGSVEHPEQLRKDYEFERARVDRLIGAIITALPVDPGRILDMAKR